MHYKQKKFLFIAYYGESMIKSTVLLYMLFIHSLYCMNDIENLLELSLYQTTQINLLINQVQHIINNPIFYCHLDDKAQSLLVETIQQTNCNITLLEKIWQDLLLSQKP